jgi:hypothetical protein
MRLSEVIALAGSEEALAFDAWPPVFFMDGLTLAAQLRGPFKSPWLLARKSQ